MIETNTPRNDARSNGIMLRHKGHHIHNFNNERLKANTKQQQQQQPKQKSKKTILDDLYRKM